MPTRRNIIGERFGRVIVLSEEPAKRQPNGALIHFSLVKCDCGQEFVVRNSSLIYGNTRSCGCLQREQTIARSSVHGGVHTVEYAAWSNMIQRCTNPNATYFFNYGGRGIKLCEGLRGFPKFLTVLGACPKGLELDRWPNNETGHYSCGDCADCVANRWPLNVRWATRRQQNQHRRNNRVLTVFGITQCLQALANHFGINRKTVTSRLELGWDVERAFTHPTQKHRPSSSRPPLPLRPSA